MSRIIYGRQALDADLQESINEGLVEVEEAGAIKSQNLPAVDSQEGYIDATEERDTMAKWIKERNMPSLEHKVILGEDGKTIAKGFMQLNKDLRSGNLPKSWERKMSVGNIRGHLVLSRLAEEWGAHEAAKFFLLPAMATLNLSASIDMAEIKQQSSANITISKAFQEQPQQSRWNIFGRSRQPINANNYGGQ